MPATKALVQITGIYLAWKTLLLLIVWAAPGEGYDTSTTLVSGTNKLVRWDAIYYTHMAHEGHVFEQEWAFGIGLSTILSTLSRGSLQSISITGIALAHISHYLSVVFLYQIAATFTKVGIEKAGSSSVAFLACCLHILAPAGVFLSAPYSESPFAALNMFGYWMYVEAYTKEGDVHLAVQCLQMVLSGISFGTATMVRSNGILSGIPLLLDAVVMSKELLLKERMHRSRPQQLMLLASTILGGLMIMAGFVLPQAIAYQEYCLGQEVRPWCSRMLPSIFSFVQSHYWGVGFLRYWTLSNVPLFLLASPVITLVLCSSMSLTESASQHSKSKIEQGLMVRLILPQLVLSLLAITNYHVQIITRLSSGYPWLYIWLARQIHQGWPYAATSVRYFVLYGLIQAALFASFLPPA